MSKCMDLYRQPGISAVWLVDGDKLPPDVDLLAEVGLPASIMTTMQRVPLTGPGTATRKAVRTGASRFEEAELTFETLPQLLLPRNPAFVVRTPSGDTFLVGSLEEPHATVESIDSTGTPGGSKGAVGYTVKHVGLHALVACRIYE